MGRSKRFALALVAALSVATLFEASAFADSRHSNRTGGRGYAGRQPYYRSGHVSRYDRYRGGYRVWLGGTRYPFYVPSSYWRPSRFRVGVYVGLGGFYNSRGYYDYHCYDCYDMYYSDRYRDRGYGRQDGLKFVQATVRGTIQSVDSERGRFVIHAEGNDSDVTALMKGHDRGFEELRVGDYVEIDGDWSRTGYFEAYAVNFDVKPGDRRD